MAAIHLLQRSKYVTIGIPNYEKAAGTTGGL